jgi:hypothetical protein
MQLVVEPLTRGSALGQFIQEFLHSGLETMLVIQQLLVVIFELLKTSLESVHFLLKFSDSFLAPLPDALGLCPEIGRLGCGDLS